jgi:hypothetical protein
MSTLQATTLLQPDRKIVSSQVTAYSDDGKYLDNLPLTSFKTIGDFNEFFSLEPGYHIHDCDIDMENGLSISSHDDGEVSIRFRKDDADQVIIDKIFEKHGLDKKLIGILTSRPGHYILIDRESNVIADFETFDEYMKNGRA